MTPDSLSGPAHSVPGTEFNRVLFDLPERYRQCRQASENICRPLTVEEHVIQTMPEVSPPKWHLAHTTWFFETFLLKPYSPGYVVYHPRFDYLFNSYYETVGTPFPRPRRGCLARPGVEDVMAYRAHVDQSMQTLLQQHDHIDIGRIVFLTETGIQHEQQHQELLYTDIMHIFAQNPLWPCYQPPLEAPACEFEPMRWLSFDAGLCEVGHAGGGFAYDNESPRHRVWLEPFSVSDRLVSNGEFLEFVEDGGYQDVRLWLSDAWSRLKNTGHKAPLYWHRLEDQWWQMTLHGLQKIDQQAPVCHVSYYEADAFARWSGARLPTEQEWEFLAAQVPVAGNFADSGVLQPRAARHGETGVRQLYGDVWEWTQSAYLPYPGFRANDGALAEYNGKFMANQMVLRGGSCFTWQDHIRPTYRNFFYPGDQWQMSGLRLARSA